jgi:hypothetical protein
MHRDDSFFTTRMAGKKTTAIMGVGNRTTFASFLSLLADPHFGTVRLRCNCASRHGIHHSLD